MTGKLDPSKVALWLLLACGGAVAQSAAGGGAVAQSGAGGGAESPSPERVLTDTADYCAQLQLQVDDAFAHAAGQPAPEIRTLSDDGQTLCRRGEIRGGIVRLRRALMALKKSPP